MNSKQNVYFDMDGTLSLWEPASIEEQTSTGFFRSRKPMENVLTMCKHLMKIPSVEVYILSCVYVDDHSIYEKKEWLDEYLGIEEEKQIFVPYGTSKKLVVKETVGLNSKDVLIDDFSKNLRDWHGIGIKMYNGINGTHGTWNGYSVHSNMEPLLMANQIVGILYSLNRDIVTR